MKKFDPKVIPYLAAITTGLMLMRAAVEFFGVWGWIIGPLAGLVTSFSLATAGSNISDIAAKRKPLAYISLLGLVVISPAVIALSSLYPQAATWAWAIFPDAAILLASSVTGKSLLAKPMQSVQQVAQAGGQVATKPAQAKKKVTVKRVKEADFIAYLQANKQASQQDVAGHFGISRQAVGQRIDKLIKKGKITP